MLLLLLLAAAIDVYLLHGFMHFDWNVCFTESIITILLLALSAWGTILIIRAYPTSVAIELNAIIIATVLSACVTLADWVILGKLFNNNPEYTTWFRHTLVLHFLIIWILSGWLATTAALRKNISSLKSRFQIQSDTATLVRDAELFKLRHQLQPHFLYNSLNSISALIMVIPEKAQEMLGKLSDFLRSSVKREAEDRIPVNDELEYIQSYLAIESVRFGDRLQVEFNNEYTDDATIPPFLLQPIIENAIKFGLYGNTGVVKVNIHIRLNDSMLLIEITNPYDPYTQPPKGTGFGLEGIKRRLYLLYARADLLEIKKNGQYFTTILKIPQQYV